MKHTKLETIAYDIFALTFVACVVMVLIETALFVDGVARYTDIMVWCVIAIVVYAWLNIWR